MRSAIFISLLALAGSSIAAPHRRHGGKGKGKGKGKVVWETVVHTVYQTEYLGSRPTPAPVPASSSEIVVAPAPSTSAAPVPEPAPVTSAPAVVITVTPTPSAIVKDTPTSTVVQDTPTPTATASSGYMATVDEYRVKLGLSKLTQDATLEANALKTAVDGNGQMVHQLNSGSFAQVLAPGQQDEFHHVFVGGWLCERPDLAGLNGECATASKGWMYTSTGHADILTSSSYTTIGCAWAGGIWACDLGF